MKKTLFLFLGFAVIFSGCQKTNVITNDETNDETSSNLPLVNPNAVESENSTTKKGPYEHAIYSASSTDGLTWVIDRDVALAEHASVPTAIEFPDGTIRIYFVDATVSREKYPIGCIETKDGGMSYAWADCTISGLNGTVSADFSIVELEDGNYRLYYYAVEGEVNSTEIHNINSAISEDGVNFVQEGTVFSYPGLVDPDIFWNGEKWILHSFSIADEKTVVATSEDGRSFEFKDYFEPEGYASTKPVMLDDGTWRMYGFTLFNANEFVSFLSEDGFNWELEDGTRFTYGEADIADPYVIRLDNGNYKMYFRVRM